MTQNNQQQITRPIHTFVNTSNGPAILATGIPVMIDSENLTFANVPKVKEVKRSAHNAIERRYRTSINDKIVELKNMLIGPDSKVISNFLKRSLLSTYFDNIGISVEQICNFTQNNRTHQTFTNPKYKIETRKYDVEDGFAKPTRKRYIYWRYYSTEKRHIFAFFVSKPHRQRRSIVARISPGIISVKKINPIFYVNC